MPRRPIWYVLDEHGNPVPEPDFRKAAMVYADPRRQLKHDVVGDLVVSTVFLGLDHSHGLEGPPILWETMIFMPDEAGTEWYEQERYSTRQAAYEGHQRAVDQAKIIVERARQAAKKIAKAANLKAKT